MMLAKNDYMLIGIAGEKRAGKDTVGKHLESYGFIRLAIADPLKEACRHIFNFTEDQLYGDEAKEAIDPYWKHSPREIFQTIGTDLFRNILPQYLKNISDDVWIKSIEYKIIELMKKGYKKFVITDVRFANDFKFVTDMGGTTWKIIRTECSDSRENRHESEKIVQTLNCDHIIMNDGTFEELFQNVDILLNIFLKNHG